MSFTTETDAQSSTLSIPSISPSFHGALFTCEVVVITIQPGNLYHKAKDFIIRNLDGLSKILLNFLGFEFLKTYFCYRSHPQFQHYIIR